MIVVRHGLMLVGPTGGGKSSNLHVLEETLSQLKQMGKEVIFTHQGNKHVTPLYLLCVAHFKVFAKRPTVRNVAQYVAPVTVSKLSAWFVQGGSKSALTDRFFMSRIEKHIIVNKSYR